jgi:hypothetical protein
MGRPLNKRFFAGGDRATVGCFYHDGSSVVESAIISQLSNSRYRVAGGGGTPQAYTSLAFLEANPDTITRTGGADFTTVFAVGDSFRVASSENTGENDGVYTIATVTSTVITITLDGDLVTNADDTTATLALVAPDGVVARLVDGTPTALGEMQVTVQPENAQSTVQATVTFTAAGGTGALLTVVIANAGYGYWSPGTGVDIGGTSDGTIDYTVSNGSLATVTINDAGTANTDATVDIADAPLADPPLESARIINARTVKTFPAVGGNTYLWPIVGVDDGAGPSGRTEADLQASDL